MDDLDTFRDHFLPNIQTFNKLSYTTWKRQNPGEAAKWETYRDAVLAGQAPTPPVLATKFGNALLAAAAMAIEVAPPPPPVSEQLFGVHQDLVYYGGDPWWSDHIRVVSALGAKVSRSSFLWDRIEPSKGTFDWSRPDAILSKLKAAGIEPLFMLVGAPSWANGSSERFDIPQDPAAYDAFVSAYANFCSKAVARYPGLRWEIWNEPNERYFWVPEPKDASQYVRLYKAARAAILAADPSARVAVGGLTGLIYGCCITGKNFLTQLVQAGCEIDHLAIHPYDGGPPSSDQAYDANFTDIGLMKAHADALGLECEWWATEWGWGGSIPEATISTYITDSLSMLRDRYPYVKVATYFFDVDTNAYPTYGLADTSYQLKPRGSVFRAFMNSL